MTEGIKGVPTSPLSPLGINSFRGEGLAALRGDATALFTILFICFSGKEATIVDQSTDPHWFEGHCPFCPVSCV